MWFESAFPDSCLGVTYERSPISDFFTHFVKTIVFVLSTKRLIHRTMCLNRAKVTHSLVWTMMVLFYYQHMKIVLFFIINTKFTKIKCELESKFIFHALFFFIQQEFYLSFFISGIYSFILYLIITLQSICYVINIISYASA